MSLRKDLPAGGIALFTYAAGTIILQNEDTHPFKTGSFTADDVNDLNLVDRIVAERWDLKSMDAGKIFRSASNAGAAATMLLMPGDIKSRGSLFMIYLEGYLLMQGLTSFAKGTTDRYRPFTYASKSEVNKMASDEKGEFLEAIDKNDIEDSFFSGDASLTAYNYIFVAKVFSDYFPESKLKYGVWGASITGTALQAYFRSRSGKHFPTDVITGSLVGGAIGYLIPHFHKKLPEKNISFYPDKYGLSVVYKF